MLVGLLIALHGSPILAETVYIRNQRLSVQQMDGARMVDLEAFRSLLTPQESQAMTVGAGSISVVNAKGEARDYQLTPYGELLEWEQALQWLGYQRRDNSGTGVIDWVNGNAGSSASTAKVWSQPTTGELAARRELSLRRADYRSAQKNYQQVMDALGQGGSEADRQRVRRLGYQIADQSPLSQLHWTFEVAKTPVPNALCTGEGFVVVTEGLLALNLTDDELAGVLGHEVAHGVRRHAQIFEERYNEARRLYAELQRIDREATAAEEANDNHRLQTLRSRYNAMVPRLKLLDDFIKNHEAYDQHEEEEADVLGIQYAAAAGFDPNGEGRALIKLSARSIELFGQAYNTGSRTHPPLKRRLEIQTLVQKRWQAGRTR